MNHTLKIEENYTWAHDEILRELVNSPCRDDANTFIAHVRTYKIFVFYNFTSTWLFYYTAYLPNDTPKTAKYIGISEMVVSTISSLEQPSWNWLK